MSKKGASKNTVAKAKHARMVSQKKNKQRKEKETTKAKRRAIMEKFKQDKNQSDGK